MRSEKSCLGDADGGNTRYDAKVAGKAKSSGMGKPLAVTQQQIRLIPETSESVEHDRNLTEGKQPGNVGEAHRAAGHGTFHEPQLRKSKNCNRGDPEGPVFLE